MISVTSRPVRLFCTVESFRSADRSAGGEDFRGEDGSIDSDNCLRSDFHRSGSAELGDIDRRKDRQGDERGFRNWSVLVILEHLSEESLCRLWRGPCIGR